MFLSFLSLLCSWGLGEVERWACPTGGEGGGSVPGRVGDGEGWTVGAGGRLRCMQTTGIPLCTGDDEFLSFRQDHQCEMLQLNIESNRKLGESMGVGLLCVQGTKSVQFPYTLPSPPLTHTSSPHSHPPPHLHRLPLVGTTLSLPLLALLFTSTVSVALATRAHCWDVIEG